MKRTCLIILLILTDVSLFPQISFTDLVKQVEKSVVTITTQDKYGNPLMMGSGFFITEKGQILSNYHIFDNAYSANITTYDGQEFQIENVSISSLENDIIKFNIENSQNIKFLPLLFYKESPLKGEDIFTIGTPLGFENTVSKGIISSIREIAGLGKIFQITAPISSGSSGSPVLNMKGEVIGIASYQFSNGQNLNFAIDVNLVDKITTNDAIFTDLSIKKVLPSDIYEAIKIIDSLSIWDVEKKLSYLNEYIIQHPNDYLGYFERAKLFGGQVTSVLLVDNRSKLTDSLLSIEVSKNILKSDRDYKKAIGLNPNDPEIYFYRGLQKYIYFDNGSKSVPNWNIQSSLDDFLKSDNLKNDGQKQARFYYLGLCYLNLSNYTESLKSFNSSLSIKNISNELSYIKRRDIYFDRAKLKLYHLSDTLGAINDLDQSIENAKADPEYGKEIYYVAPMLALRAELFYYTNKLDKALNDLRIVNSSTVLSPEGNSDYTNFFQALIIRLLDGDLEEALTSINKAIARNSLEYYYFWERSNIYFQLKEYQNALIDINKVYELNPNKFNDDHYSFRSRIKGLQNDNIGAIKDIDLAIKMNPNNDYYYYLKGIYLSNLGDNYGATKQYDKAIELNPKDPGYYVNRGWSKLNSNKTDACADWSKAGEMGKYEAYDLIQKYCK